MAFFVHLVKYLLTFDHMVHSCHILKFYLYVSICVILLFHFYVLFMDRIISLKDRWDFRILYFA